MLQRCHFDGLNRNIHSIGGQKKKSGSGGQTPVPWMRKEVVWACHFLMETAHWITGIACGCSDSNRSTSGPNLKSLQTGSSLLRREPGKASGRENIPESLRWIVNKKLISPGPGQLCRCLETDEPAGWEEMLSLRRYEQRSGNNCMNSFVLPFLFSGLTCTWVQVRRWGEVKWSEVKKTYRTQTTISE